MITRCRRRLSGRRHDERGAILIVSAVFLVVMVLAAALAVDIGLEGVDKRSDHRVADLAALDGARALNTTVVPCVDAARYAAATLAATQSAQRNGFSILPGSGNSLTLDVGKWDPVARTYTQVAPGVACTANAVHVVVGSVTHYKFQPFSQSLSAEAYATQNGLVTQLPTPTTTTTPPVSGSLWGGFSVGSFLATIDSTHAALMDEVVCQALTGTQVANVGALATSCPKFNLSAASWQGLGNANVTMDALGKALAARGAIASPDQVGGATVQAADLFNATGDALTQKGDTANAQIMYNLAQGVSGSRAVQIPKLVSEQGAQNSAIAATQPVNVANLVVGSATTQIANGTNALAVLDTGFSVPNVSSSGLNLALVQAPSSYYGNQVDPSPVLTTAQLSSSTSTKTGLTLQVSNLPVSVPLLSGLTQLATLSGTISVSLTGAGAQAQMRQPVCGTSVQMWADPQPYSTSVTGASLTLNLLGMPLGVGVSGTQTVDGGAATNTFNVPTDLGTDWRVGSTSLQLSQLNYAVTVNGSVPLATTLANVQNAVASNVNSLVSQFDGPLASLFRQLGLAVGGADVSATALNNLDATGNSVPCSSSTTTTAPTTSTTSTTTPAQAAPVLVK